MQEKRKSLRKAISVLLIIAALFFCAQNKETVMPHVINFLSYAGIYTASMALPESGAQKLQAKIAQTINGDNASLSSVPPEREVIAKPDPVPSASESASSSMASSETVSSGSGDASYVEPPAGAQTGKVLTKFFSKSGANLIYKNVYVSNRTTGPVDLAKELATRPNVTIKKNEEPMVLIIHTHATEAYLENDYGYYIKGTDTRSTDETKSVVRVGEEIAKQLNGAGIKTIQDKTKHDYPSYSGGYERCAKTINSYLKKYPSIQVILDIHRDAITYDNGDKVKPTVTINGKKAAQIMICSGRQDRQVLPFPNWRQNLRFALRVQEACETDYPGLARPLYFVSKRYNQYLSPGSLLIEMGSEGNTLEEAIYTGELLGKSLVKVLDKLQK